MRFKKSVIQIFYCLIMVHASLFTMRPVVSKVTPKVSALEQALGQPLGMPRQLASTGYKQVQQKMVDTMVDQLAPSLRTTSDLIPPYRFSKTFIPSSSFGAFKGTRINFFRASDQQPVVESPSMSLQEAQTILNVSDRSSAADIKAAYRALLHTLHPDMGGKEEEFEILKLAYEIALRGPAKPGALIPKGWPQGLPYLDTDVDFSGKGLDVDKYGKKFSIEIKEVSPVIGRGGFALEYIPAGAVIQEYTGIVKVVHHSLLPKMPYAFTVSNVDPKTGGEGPGATGEYQLIIDAGPAGNETRFFNHSNNANAGFAIDPHYKGKAFVVALRDIQPGEEITVSYGDAYWKDKEQKPA